MADLEHLWPPFRRQVQNLLADTEARKLGVYVVSGYRSPELQASLYADALKRYGSAKEAGKWVAPPGRSNHGPKVDDHGHEPGPWGRAVDLGIPGIPAVQGRWPAKIVTQMALLTSRYQMHQAMPWESWHFEPDPILYLQAAVAPTPPPLPPEAPMAMVVIDPKAPADSHGRLPNWESDQDGNLYCWNGARQLRPLSSFAKVHPPIVAMLLEPTGDGVVLFGNDTHQEPDGSWVRSTYKITVGM